MRHLLFQMAAPLMSFGSPGAKLDRATDLYPLKGMALGLVGCALGKKRDDPWHERASNLGFGVMTVKAGHLLEDYHTVATPRGTDRYGTRREEVSASDYTVETWRSYVSDAYFVVALWGDSVDLDDCWTALREPAFEVYAGRKSCPLSLPMCPLIYGEQTSLKQAFLSYSSRLYPEAPEGQFDVHWGVHPDPGLEVLRMYPRKDEVLNRAKRLFVDRVEYEGRIELPKKEKEPTK